MEALYELQLRRNIVVHGMHGVFIWLQSFVHINQRGIMSHIMTNYIDYLSLPVQYVSQDNIKNEKNNLLQEIQSCPKDSSLLYFSLNLNSHLGFDSGPHLVPWSTRVSAT